MSTSANVNPLQNSLATVKTDNMVRAIAFEGGSLPLGSIQDSNISANVNPQLNSLAAVKTNNTVRASAFNIGSGPGSLSNLTDVRLSYPSTGQVLIYDGSAAKWNNRTLAGDLTVNYAGIVTLSTANSTPGTFGSEVLIPIITVNSKGLITSVSTAVIGASQWTTTGNDIYYNVGNVGINNSAPEYTLDVNGSIRAFEGLAVGSNTSTSNLVTLGARPFYVNSGATSTWILPPIDESVGRIYFVKNRGSGIVTLTAAAGEFFYVTSQTSTWLMRPGEAYILICDGTYWEVM